MDYKSLKGFHYFKYMRCFKSNEKPLKRKNSIFNFNHINNKLDEDEVTMLKNLYAQYHQKTWCYHMAYKHFKNINLGLNVLAIVLTSTGVVVGSVTLNPIVLSSISGSGIILQGFLKMKNYNRKIEMCKFAYTSYQKILNKIRSYLRGEPYDVMDFVLETHLLDDQVTDLCPIVDKYKSKYNKVHEGGLRPPLTPGIIRERRSL